MSDVLDEWRDVDQPNIADELDALAAEGRVTNVSLSRRHGGGWQCYLTLGRTGTHIAQIDDTPSSALAKAIEKLPTTEAYDLKFSAAAVSERAKEGQQAAAPAEPVGIFD
ncbi:hypothetical protein ACRQ5Q_24530 [Bradyrhizobium sp. PMVTL-01]|uniref:hypothetical protein n=1 Tax=Bradyrhizobium sp. PMVTL-01 TaxID=3434999 RepID=UPI003F72AECC